MRPGGARRHRSGSAAQFQQITVCPACHGRGSVIEHPCPKCQGSGEMEQDEVLTVRIPQGVEEGVALRIPGKGMPSPEAGGISGDLFVVARSRSDPRFERAGPDLWRQETVSLTDAVLGAALQVPTLNGSVKLSMPAGTQPGAVFRLKGKGLPEFGSERRGEMYVRVEVQIPQQLSRDERQLYELLRSIQRS